MTIRMRIAATAIAGVGALGLAMGTAGAALASSGPITAVTHASNHPDTTSVSGPATLDSPNGPVWAYDNLALKFTVTPNGEGVSKVVITTNGSFAGFADPTTGQALTSNGSVAGSITYYWESPNGAADANPANLPAQEPPTVGLSTMITQLFGGGENAGPTWPGNGDYTFSYQHGNYVQDTNGATGDVVGH
jgi:hypothetical protein